MSAPDTFSELDLVALVKPLPEHNLPIGQTGTIVMVHNAGEAFEVEFPLNPRQSIVATIRPCVITRIRSQTANIVSGSDDTISTP